MRARSHTELDSRQHLACLPNQNKLDIDHQQQTAHVSWIKRYYFYFLEQKKRIFRQRSVSVKDRNTI
jgi:hypothetical protein